MLTQVQRRLLGAMFQITPETQEDYWEVEQLFDLSFAPGREALSSYRLRAANDPVSDLCLVGRDADGILAGAIRFWPITIGTPGRICLLLGPIAVHPTRQGEGLGGILMREALGRARRAGWKRVLLIGDAPYYARFGFQRIDGIDFPPPTNPARILCLELENNAFEGVQGQVLPYKNSP